MGVGIQGGIVGHGGQLIIVDDPYKNDIQANNPTERENISSIFKSAVLTRTMGQGNAVIVIHTRWHDDDLIGELEKTGDWITINIPLVWEKGEDKLLHRKIGETLCPELGFDSEWAEMTRKAIGNRLFQANCQGKPYIESGNLVKRSDIKFYNATSKPSAFEELTLSCDLSFGGVKKENDPYCMTLWGRNGGDHYLLKIWGKRASFLETQKTLKLICGQYPQLKRKLIEKKAMGGPIIETLGKEIGGFIPFDPKGASKEARFNSVTPYFESGNIYFPDESLEPDIEEYIDQLLRFPNVGHDDFVDTISQYLLNYEYKYGGRIKTDSYYNEISNVFRGVKV
jgi:predicted phage terminase large subunit-like protein